MPWPVAARLAASVAMAIVVTATAVPTTASPSNAGTDGARPGSRDMLSTSSCVPPSPGRQTVRVASQGEVFEVLVHVPAEPGANMPLVFDLHGSAHHGAGQLERSQLAETAEAEGFVLAAPTGGIPDGDRYSWNIPGVPLANGEEPSPDARDDIQFISDIIDTLVSQWCTDADRVYATGYSGGGRMSSALACELDSMAAIAPVAGLRFGAPDEHDPTRPEPGSCAPGRPVPVISFHGLLDATNPYRGGGTPAWGYSVPVAAQAWAQSNGCHLGPVHRRLGTVTSRTVYRGCTNRADVVSIVADDGAHTWPGSTHDFGEPVSHEVPANATMWRFFEQHPRR